MIFVILSTVLSLLLAFYFYIHNRYQFFKKQGVLGPQPKFPFGNTKSSILKKRNIVYDVDDVYREFKDKSPFVGIFAMLTPYLVVFEPKLLRQIFVTDFKKFRNNDFSINHDKDPIIARNPFWMKDEAWKEKRSEFMLAMTTVKLKAMYPLILDGAKNFSTFIKKEIKKDNSRIFDARDISARYTCDTICSTTFGTDAQSFTSSDPFFYKKGRQLITGIKDYLQSWFPDRMLRKDITEFFVEIANDAIKMRKESQIKQDDFLSYTIALKERKGMSDIDAAAHCVLFFLDGFETTSVTLHHTFYEIGKNKRVQTKLRKEIEENLDENGLIGYDKLLELPYLNQIYYEVLRLHPPIPFTTRVCSENVEVKAYGGQIFVIKKDQPIWIPIHSIQRDPEFFPDALSFNPERFNAEFGGVKSFTDRSVLIPFGDGPRICSGIRFAYIQVKAAIVEIIKNFEVSVDESVPDDLKISAFEFWNVTDSKLMLKFKLLKDGG